MILYHGTTKKRALEIFRDKAIKKDVKRHYTEEKSGGGYSTQGYIYLTNEITFSLYFANACNIEDKTDYLFLFKVDIPVNKISPYYDEIRINGKLSFLGEKYSDDLDYSLREFKSCRVGYDIDFGIYEVKYCIIDVRNGFSFSDIVTNVGRDYEYVIKNYTDNQVAFIENLNWVTVQ